ncbi:arylsulfotransferase family protein [Brevibacillus sp. NRS-1366]|uniref:arylsulfotransferase family protein n=1 Tax=Brevibacillus sp. NRS-1366 TaxID=3233899 RepID=UPI003D2156B4
MERNMGKKRRKHTGETHSSKVNTPMNTFQSGMSSQTSTNHSSQQVWNFFSAPTVHPMKVTINIDKPGTASGFIFVAPYTIFGETMIGQTGALIMDQAGNPVWFRPLTSIFTQNTDFRVQSYRGQPVLTMWEGTISGTQSANPNLPDGDPEPGAFYLIINQNYQVIKKLTAKKGFNADVHEFTITRQNTALFTAVKQVPADLTPYGGPANGYIDNYSIQEVDLVSGKLLFFWDVLAHVDPVDSMVSASTATSSNNIWDCFHVNSVEEGPNDTLLISMRNMWAIYHIDKKSGNITWQLGGKQSDFTFGPNAAFSWQHDARYRSGNRLSLFDDACCASSSSPPQGSARGLILQLDFQNKIANVGRTYYHDPLLFVPSQGNVQKLSNGNQFIGWGQEPYLSEFKKAGNTVKDPSTNLIYDMQFPNQNLSYRAFKNEWVGLPLYPPSIAVNIVREDSAIVYASWNGSTETVSWQVLAGPTQKNLSVVVISTPRTGFETDIHVHSVGPYFQLNALNSSGQILGTSRTARVKREKK